MPTVVDSRAASRPIDVGLWILQGLLAATFVAGGLWKLLVPHDVLVAKFPWTGEVPPSFLVATSVVDVIGGAGLLLPSLTRILPGLAPLAALGCALQQV